MGLKEGNGDGHLKRPGQVGARGLSLSAGLQPFLEITFKRVIRQDLKQGDLEVFIFSPGTRLPDVLHAR